MKTGAAGPTRVAGCVSYPRTREQEFRVQTNVKVELLRQPTDGESPHWWEARINGAAFPVAGYDVSPGEDGAVVVMLAVPAAGFAVGDGQPPAAQPPAAVKPVNQRRLWDGSGPDPRANIPGFRLPREAGNG